VEKKLEKRKKPVMSYSSLVKDYFNEPSEEQKALANPLVNADFIKLFLVRKGRIVPSEDNSFNEADNLSDAFYQLFTAGPEALLASVTIGLEFGKQISLEEFKQKVEKIYAENPVTVRDDLQKGRWGGRSNENGYQVDATVTNSKIPGFYSVEVTVHSTDIFRKVPLAGHVAFFLHDTFRNEIEYVPVENGMASLQLSNCYEAFTLGAYTEDGTALELDLNEISGYPEGFYWNDRSSFKDRVTELYKQKPVRVKDDLQKGRWGGKNIMNDKTLSASVEASGITGSFNVRLKLVFIDPKSDKGEVAFFLHDSFGRQIRFVPIDNGSAELKIKAYEAFTVGAYTEDGTELELDLQTQTGYPPDFYYSDKEPDKEAFA
jgi:hypothetical protein